jgi:two-component system LytT family response regulator
VSKTEELRVLVVDDEPLARSMACDLLRELEGVSALRPCGDGLEAVRRIREEVPDLVLLDVQMPALDGFQVLERLGTDLRSEVVFVTAHDQYTLRAFEVHALDYVLKPFEPGRLGRAVEHARDRIRAGTSEPLVSRVETLLESLRERGSGRYARRLTVRRGDRIRFVALEDVDWIEAARNYVRLHVGEETSLVRSTLKGLLQRLDPGRFVRIHRSAAVNLDRVREVQPWVGGDYVVILETGRRLRVSRTYTSRLLELTH